jgi:hypothetical protein
MHRENAYYYLRQGDVAEALKLPPAPDVGGCSAYLFHGPWRDVRVELYDYPVAERRAWLPHLHAYVGGLGTRVQMESENLVDLLAFKLYLRQHVEHRYKMPG